MAKEALKAKIIDIKGNHCSIANHRLPFDYSLFDVHRENPKRKNGEFTDKNTALAIPVERMKETGTHRQREVEIDHLKTMIDDRRHLMKLKIKVQNQFLAYKRGTDRGETENLIFLNGMLEYVSKRLTDYDKDVAKYVKSMSDPVAKAALGVRSIGPITVAHCMAYIDIHKARHASSLWAYVGLDKPSYNRYTKGCAGGGNKTLRTVLYTMADSQIKGRGPYRAVYDNVKHRLSNSDKETYTRNTAGQLVKAAWKDTKPSHRDGAGKRAIMKHFLADYWYVARTLAGLDTTPIYAEAMLGGTHRTIMPEERGWIY